MVRPVAYATTVASVARGYLKLTGQPAQHIN